MTGDNTPNNNIGTVSSVYDKLIKILHRFYIDARKNMVIFLMSLIVMTSIVLFLNYRKSKVYRASFTVVYEELVRKVYGDRLEKLNAILQSNPFKAAAYMGLDSAKVESLVEVGATNILGEPLSKDMNTDKIPFVVHIYAKDTTYIPEYQKAIVYFLENGSSFLADKKKIKIQETDKELNFLDEQLNMLDTLKRQYSVASLQSSVKDEQGKVSTGNIYEISYELYKKRQELIKKNEMPMNLYVIDDAIGSRKGGISNTLAIEIGIVLGCMVYLFIAYILLPVVRYKE